MAGTALASAVIAVTATLSVGLAAVGGASAASQRVASAADAAALAASDVSMGAVTAEAPACAVAARVAEAHGADLSSCVLEGAVATTEVRAAYAGVTVVARARAGPPE